MPQKSFDKSKLNAVQRERYERLVAALACYDDPRSHGDSFGHALACDDNDILKVPGALSAANMEAMGRKRR